MDSVGEILWLASYPKSGNTWLRYLLYSYFFEIPQKMLALNKSMPAIHEIMKGHKNVDTAKKLLYQRSQKISTEAGSQQYIVKTHFAYSTNHPLIEDTHKVIVIVRDPRSVLLSAVNYKHMRGKIKRKDYVSYAREFIAMGGDSQWLKQGYGTWQSHVESWMSFDGVDKLFIGYADLKNDTVKVFSDVIRFLGVEPDETKLQAAVEATQLDRLRKLEIAARDKKSESKRKLFFNKGSTNISLDTELGVGLDSYFDKHFLDVQQIAQSLGIIL